MLSYQHGFHAGNRADVLKHAVLEAVLGEIAQAPRPVFYIETHAGRGRYDLTGAQATKRGEALSGVQSLLVGDAPRPLQPWLKRVAAHGVTDYPGSPVLALSVLPETSRAMFFEMHPAEHAALTQALHGEKRAQIKQADGYAGALKLAPRGGEQLVVLIDPSYETVRDIDALISWVPRALSRWPHAVMLVWLPLYRDGREGEFIAFLNDLDDSFVASARWPVAADETSSLEGSAMAVFRAPGPAIQKAKAIADALQGFWNRT
jgi:23S rRNA (adenine2030-N6)-methyltransferase